MNSPSSKKADKQHPLADSLGVERPTVPAPEPSDPGGAVSPSATVPASERDLAALALSRSPASSRTVLLDSNDAASDPLGAVKGSSASTSGGASSSSFGSSDGASARSAESHSSLSVSARARAITLDGRDSYDELAAPIADPLIGVVVAERYRILELLGRGGMGIVYKVEHVRIGKLLAMKLLTGELSRNPEVVRRFKHEALTASKLSSPNTVQVFDFGVSDGLTYLVMELVAGEDLGRHLRSVGPLPTGRLSRIVIQVCSSMAEAHQKSIVHRDIKPENIMLLRGRDGTDVAKVLDFGLAKLREGSELNDVTSAGAIVGTPYFMSPEQVRGDPVDARSDIYSLGAVMYRAATGHYPFNGPTPMAVFTKHLTEMPAPPADRAPELGLSRSFCDIVMRCLAKDPDDRFDKVETLQKTLLETLEQTGTSSVQALLDSDAVRAMAKNTDPVELSRVGAKVTAEALATRDEVERYERKLRRRTYGLAIFSLAVVGAGAAGGFHLFRESQKVVFEGMEDEPNNASSEANALPFGRTIAGHIGQRIDANTSDRDFYRFTVPASDTEGSQHIALSLTALPNFATCAFLYPEGHNTALAQYCVGRINRTLRVPRLALAPGNYLVAVSQDLDPYGSVAVPVHENISDQYELTIERSADVDEQPWEVEPNDQLGAATVIVPGQRLEGQVGWVNDQDFVCATKDANGVGRFKIEEPARDHGTVLEVTPFVDGAEGVPIRVHAGRAKDEVTDVDVLSPYVGPAMGLSGQPPCLRLRLAPDPWADGAIEQIPRGHTDPWVITFTLEEGTEHE